MKTKIFALIISILCLSVILVACDKPCETHVDENNDAACDVCGESLETESESETEAETEGVCDHTDTDANKLCDACGKAIVVIVEKVPVEKETAADMVVNEIPEDAKVEDYVNTAIPEIGYLSESVEIKGIVERNGQFVLREIELEDGTKEISVYDLIAEESIWSASNTVSDTKTVVHNVVLSDLWFTVVTTENVPDENDPDIMIELKRSIKIYTYSMDQVGETYVYDGIESVIEFVPPVADEIDQECYVEFQDKVFVIDPETYEIIYTSDPDTLVKRPDFDVVNGNHGYVFDYWYDYDENDEIIDWGFNGIYVYDLSEWIDCVYSYEIPSYAEYADANTLQNGDILLWYHLELPDNAVSYDYISGGTKYDLVYKIIDIKTFEMTDAEFGYEIIYTRQISADEGYTEAAEAYNLVVAYPVVNGYVNYNETLALIVDNDLNIVCEYPTYYAYLIDDGLFLNTIVYNDYTYAFELVDVNGDHVAYLSYDVNADYGYKLVGNKVYDYENKLLIDLDKFTVVANMIESYNGGYAVVSREVEDAEGNVSTVYAVAVPGKDNKTIDTDKDNWTFINATEYGYQVSYNAIDAEGVSKTYYEFYNPANELVLKTESMIVDIYEIEDGVAVAITSDAQYLLK